MRLLDRYILRHFFAAYLACFVSFLALYIVLDVFTKLDEIAEHLEHSRDILHYVSSYYLYRLPLFFERLSGILALVAAMFTLAWLQRQNEILPLLTAGIPVRRVLYPLLGATVLVVGLAVANQEWVVPRCSPQLQRSISETKQQTAMCIGGCYDANMVHLEGKYAYPQRQIIEFGRVTLPANLVGRLVHISCLQMRYRPANQRDGSGWYLTGVSPEKVDVSHAVLNRLKSGKGYFLHTDLSFDRLVRHPNWFHFESTVRLSQLLQDEEQLPRRSEVTALFHRRLTEPALTIILVILGVPFILARPERSLFLKIGLCLVLIGLFQGIQFGCAYLAKQEYLDAALAAWLPVLLFGPPAVAGLDAVRS